MIRFILLVLLPMISSVLSDAVKNCPRSCVCRQYSKSSGLNVRVDCTPTNMSDPGKLNHIPDDLPTDLTDLLLDNQSIQNIAANSFTRYHNLNVLSLRGNHIEKIENRAFAGLAKLSALDLGKNKIASIEQDVFKDVSNLEKLNLDNNKLKSVPDLTALHELTNLDLDDNVIEECSLSNKISSVKLTSVVLSGNVCPSLEWKHLEVLANCRNLRSLKLAKTNCSLIAPDTFFKLSTLMKLDLSENKQLKWSVVEKIQFPVNLKVLNIDSLHTGSVDTTNLSGFLNFLPVSLQSLRMKYNKFNTKMPDFRHLSNLTRLYLESNDFTELPSLGDDGKSGFPPSIQYIYIRNNKFADINQGVFSGLHNLTLLDLCYSNIKTFHPLAFGELTHSLKDLVLTHALQRKFPKGLLKALPNLERLTLNENNFGKLDLDVRDDFDVASNLSKLVLSGNKLSELPRGMFNKMKRLKILTLNDNELGDLISMDETGDLFAGLDSIQHLSLENNDIADIPSGFLSRIGPGLKNLNVEMNRIRKYPAEVISRFEQLQYVNLDGNAIRILSPDDFAKTPTSARIHLWQNPMDCSCDNYEFFRWLQTTEAGKSRPYFIQMSCGSPLELKGLKPPSVDKLSMVCADSAGSTAIVIFFSVVLAIIAITFSGFIIAKKFRPSVLYKRLSPGSANPHGQNSHMTSSQVQLSGLDDGDDFTI